MTLRFRPATVAEYLAYRQVTTLDYSEQMTEHAGMTLEIATSKAESDLAELLPASGLLATHRLTVAEEHGERVGIIWVGPSRGEGGGPWVYFVSVEERHRGRGFGRDLMLEAERAARADGGATLGLNVFGGNAAAIGLYQSLGYHIEAQQMSKTLTEN